MRQIENLFEVTVITPHGEMKDRVYAKDVDEAKKIFEKKYGKVNIPYLPKLIPNSPNSK